MFQDAGILGCFDNQHCSGFCGINFQCRQLTQVRYATPAQAGILFRIGYRTAYPRIAAVPTKIPACAGMTLLGRILGFAGAFRLSFVFQKPIANSSLGFFILRRFLSQAQAEFA